MFTIDETEDMLNEIANELPEEFFGILTEALPLKRQQNGIQRVAQMICIFLANTGLQAHWADTL